MEEVRRIHKEFYSNEFELPEDHYLGAFIIEDNNQCVTAGGIRTISEIIAVTDKNISTRKRVDGLEMLLQASSLVCSNYGYEHIHAFVQDENWLKVMLKKGFHFPRGKALIYG